jgi:membrane protein DedA with SNARE-associated domain
VGELLTDLARWATDVVHSFGYVGVFVLIVLGDLRLPIPTELTLPLTGFLVGQGRHSFVSVLLTATAARVTHLADPVHRRAPDRRRAPSPTH